MFEEEKPEILRDHFEECLRHFGNLFNSKIPRRRRGRYQAMRPLANFCGVSLSTVQHWFDDMGSPSGELKIKMMCYLSMHGYKVIEFERMQKVLRNFAELIGFGVLDAKSASALLKYKDPANMYEVFRGGTGMGKEKEEQMWATWKEYRDRLEQRKKEVLKSCRLEIFSKPTSIRQLALLSKQPDGATIKTRQSALLKILEGSLELLDEGFLKNLSDDELAAFAQPILRISSHFSVLSSKVLVVKGDRDG